MDITRISLFDQDTGTACQQVRLRGTWISLVFIYLIKIWVWHLLRPDSDVHKYHWSRSALSPLASCYFSRVLFWGHWYPCFGFLVTSPLGFKARVGSALFALRRQM